jgi:hypothetical protein
MLRECYHFCLLTKRKLGEGHSRPGEFFAFGGRPHIDVCGYSGRERASPGRGLADNGGGVVLDDAKYCARSQTSAENLI